MIQRVYFLCAALENITQSDETKIDDVGKSQGNNEGRQTRGRFIHLTRYSRRSRLKYREARRE